MSARVESRVSAGGDGVAPMATIGRLSLYLRQLQRFLKEGRSTVSSRRLGEALGVGDAQVRKDLAYFGQFGRAGVGYKVEELVHAVRRILGTDRHWSVALVGIGNLGRALVRYRGFRAEGFEIVAIFDLDKEKLGQRVERIPVEHPDRLPARVAEDRIEMGIIAVPGEAAQSVADRLVAAGVKGILNFAPVPLTVPKHVGLVSVDLAIQLETLSYRAQAARSAAPQPEHADEEYPVV